jgi:acetoin utilization deacetylase AcuC-like enzyme
LLQCSKKVFQVALGPLTLSAEGVGGLPHNAFMRAFYSDTFVLPLPPGHRFPMEKYRLLREAVQAGLPGLSLCEARAATPDELCLAHESAYVKAVLSGTLSSAAQREIGFPWSPAMAERACRSVGATLDAAEAALTDGVAVNLAGGTHHAYADKGSGFCVFNDVAVATRRMQARYAEKGRSLRVAVIDLDVHQGNGTAAIFQGDPSVFTLSMHGEKNFPFRKEASDLDVDLPDGCRDEAYLSALDDALSRLWEHHQDEPAGLIFYLAGADPHEGDRLGRLKISTEGLRERDRRVLQAAGERRIPVVISMAGGYGHDIHTTVQVQTHTLAEALAHHQVWAAGMGAADAALN